MREIKVKQQFLDSVIEIRDYIAQESPQSADKFVLDLKAKMIRIIEYPETFSPEKNLLTKRLIYRFAPTRRVTKSSSRCWTPNSFSWTPCMGNAIPTISKT